MKKTFTTENTGGTEKTGGRVWFKAQERSVA